MMIAWLGVMGRTSAERVHGVAAVAGPPASTLAISLRPLAIGLTSAADRSGALTRALFRWLLIVAAQFHLAIDALALQLFLQGAERLVDVVVADGDQHAVDLSMTEASSAG
jgi:hypothetical protein